MSAVPCELCELWLEAKRRESEANGQRIAIEEALYKMLAEIGLPEQEASKTYSLGTFKVTVKRSLTYSLDKQADLTVLCAEIPRELQPIKQTLDTTGLKWLRENRADLYAKIAKGISVKPAKTNFAIEPKGT
jgi:hypothetical protein